MTHGLMSQLNLKGKGSKMAILSTEIYKVVTGTSYILFVKNSMAGHHCGGEIVDSFFLV